MNEQVSALTTVAMNFRYVAAWNEVSARIAQRQNAITIYATGSGLFLTILAGATVPQSIDRTVVSIFSLLLPILSLCFAFLNYKHNETINLLREFLAECERKGDAASLQLPTYNSHDGHYRARADQYRRWHDFSAVLLIILFNVIGLYFGYILSSSLLDLQKWPVVLYFIIWFWSVVQIARRPRWAWKVLQALEGALIKDAM